MSPASYNGKVGVSLLCPVTSKPKGYPFEVVIPQDLPFEGVILADQVKSLDWQSRQRSSVKYHRAFFQMSLLNSTY
ncbi:type II toxin-antitoxin system PemK/MazF family toxin [Paenibacillus sp. FSL H8-0259]|uniref:type II toxin-antitoxin system PemK/MazF family toxin n=1 Tax=Paenibacillus sp. FSL H8-0259 TaxID=1920423 RepID=UPI00211665D6|nr:type II toxin-antitoxin system PemK/MazF family toxin [Paenibacillus sp. FSL H8-0259]